MLEVVTKCPTCHASFLVTEKKLLTTEGSVRCVACLRFFQAEDYFISPMLEMKDFFEIERDYWTAFEAYISEIKGSGIYQTKISGLADSDFVDNDGANAGKPVYSLASTTTVLSREDQSLIKVRDPSIVGASREAEKESSLFASSLNLGVIEELPWFLEQRRSLFSFQSLKWLSGIIILLFFLFFQYAYMRKEQLVHELPYRSYYETSCRLLGCVLPEFNDPRLLEPRDLVIRSHPRVKDALIADAVLRNGSEYRQLFPLLRLRFFDIDGKVVASRAFSANEYLGGEMRGLKFIPGHTDVRFSLEIVDPGEQALGYEMDVIPYGKSK